ncbi:ABC transporter [Kiloniella spongiae]|uniref:ABC transporter n=1 Tax=Kiloniella spongiae TaxID=1489064 RepID=A0A0H2MB12_9PROT|nr:ATP-binding cassette domain-containing protein [Kiloniella spongiae]KLN59371.1 ABC transporter [Kiloniella spongiae]
MTENGKINTALEVKGLSKSFNGLKALDAVDLKVSSGETLVIIGPSGSGKTLLLKVLLGIIPYDMGHIFVNGHPKEELEDNSHNFLDCFGMLFQQSALFDSMTVWENIAFKELKKQNANREEVKASVIALLDQVGLKQDVADLFPAELSGGMQKRVGLARAFAGDPEFLFLDEPTAGLDPIMSNSISQLINQQAKEHFSTSIIISSDLDSARSISTNIMMLHEGKVVWHGTTDDLDKTKNPYVQQFIHKSAEGPISVLTE